MWEGECVILSFPTQHCHMIMSLYKVLNDYLILTTETDIIINIINTRVVHPTSIRHNIYIYTYPVFQNFTVCIFRYLKVYSCWAEDIMLLLFNYSHYTDT